MANKDKNWKNKIDTDDFEAPGFVREGIVRAVADLRVGDQIITRWRRNGRAETTKKVEKIEECEGMWRTHVHVNKNQCYDTRVTVRVK